MARRGSGYRTAVLCSALLHGGLLYLLISGWHPEFHRRELAQPSYIEATLLQVERPAPQPVKSAPAKSEPPRPAPPAPEPPKPEPPKPEPPKPKPAADDTAAKHAEQVAQEKAAQQKLAQETAVKEKMALQKAAQEKAAAEKTAKEKAAKEQAAKEQEKAAKEKLAKEKAAREKAEQEARAQREQQQAAAQQSVSTYGDYVRDRIAGNWSRPPSARRDMQVELQIRIVPTGQVMGVVVTRSSGDPAFDQSAVSAVERAGRFDRLQELARKDPLLFEQYFRKFTLVFRPEDLRL